VNGNVRHEKDNNKRADPNYAIAYCNRCKAWPLWGVKEVRKIMLKQAKQELLAPNGDCFMITVTSYLSLG